MRERFLLDNPLKTEADFESWASQISPNFEWYTAQQQRGGLWLLITLTYFTESYDNNLMWSHYANNHTSICVEYHPEIMTALQNIPGHLAYAPVTYSDEPPIIDAAHFPDKETIQKMIFTKQSEWSYEKESRLVRISDDDTNFAMLRQNQIKSLIGETNHVDHSSPICLEILIGCISAFTVVESKLATGVNQVRFIQAGPLCRLFAEQSFLIFTGS